MRMSKSEKKGLVPTLRFPEFRDEGEWEIKKLGDKDVSNFVKNRVALSELNIDTYVSTENILPNFGGIASASKLPPSGSFTAYRKDDILIANIRPYLKKIWVANKSGAASNDVVVVRPKATNGYSLVPFLLKNDVFINYVMKGAKGVKMPRGDISLMKEYPVALPNPEEQQKIADCLASIDDLVTFQTQKLDGLKAHKKGLMQQLFPVEGETLPKLRFPEFRDKGEWRNEQLGNIGKVSMCKRIMKHETSESGDIPFYKIGTFGKKADAYISKEIYDLYRVKYSFPKKGDILISASGTIGRTVVFDGKPAYFQDSNIVWVDNDESLVSNAFLAFIYQKIKWVTDDNTIARLYNDNLRNLEIIVPSLPEQQKIANCLASIDKLVTAQTQKIEALKAHKKGLMQQLFPLMETTG